MACNITPPRSSIPCINLPETEQSKELASQFAQCAVISVENNKTSSSLISVQQLVSVLAYIWPSNGWDRKLMRLKPGAFLAKFSSEETLEEAIRPPLLSIGDFTVSVKRWSCGFGSERRADSVWVKLRGLPLNYWHLEGFTRIVSCFGHLEKVHEVTEKLADLEEARVRVVCFGNEMIPDTVRVLANGWIFDVAVELETDVGSKINMEDINEKMAKHNLEGQNKQLMLPDMKSENETVVRGGDHTDFNYTPPNEGSGTKDQSYTMEAENLKKSENTELISAQKPLVSNTILSTDTDDQVAKSEVSSYSASSSALLRWRNYFASYDDHRYIKDRFPSTEDNSLRSLNSPEALKIWNSLLENKIRNSVCYRQATCYPFVDLHSVENNATSYPFASNTPSWVSVDAVKPIINRPVAAAVRHPLIEPLSNFSLEPEMSSGNNIVNRCTVRQNKPRRR